jgi:hypothetical protein
MKIIAIIKIKIMEIMAMMKIILMVEAEIMMAL